MSEEIKHCPFCREQPEAVNTEEARYIGCKGAKCYIAPCIGSIDFYDLTFEEMVKVWNTRY